MFKVYKKSLLLKFLSFSVSMIFVATMVFASQVVPMFASANARKVPIYCVEKPTPVASLSFDAAWGADKTLQILDELDSYGIKATFFLVGFWIDNFPEMVKEIDKRGHEIGTHSETHPHMSKLSAQKQASELKTSCEKISALIKKPVTVFRPPFGEYNNSLIEEAQKQGLHTIQWDVDSLDWKGLSAQQIVDRVYKSIKNGSIVLFHNNSDNIVKALPMVVEMLKFKKFQFLPIGELIYTENFYIDKSGVQRQNAHQ